MNFGSRSKFLGRSRRVPETPGDRNEPLKSLRLQGCLPGIRLALSSIMESQRDPGMDDAIAALGPNSRLLLIDNCSFVRRVFSLTFGELGYGAATAASISEGVRMASEEKFDVVILDGEFSESQQMEIEGARGHADPGQLPIILKYESLAAESAPSSQEPSTLEIHRRKPFTPLVIQIRELLAQRSGNQ